ncbi:hypothetical protein E1162_10095 [Rhodobacteraceae bacterium RKSG542]|uniref:hypothetical protein n=1 Tax=Pseudovibrio flavus TaxID=2529854 RepID=UPI0012BD1008|nr:hypothetical protein [Pseudovibrio flavus]MTI17589.1 hypothetical protein [Pseudovibrio flavus]
MTGLTLAQNTEKQQLPQSYMNLFEGSGIDIEEFGEIEETSDSLIVHDLVMRPSPIEDPNLFLETGTMEFQGFHNDVVGETRIDIIKINDAKFYDDETKLTFDKLEIHDFYVPEEVKEMTISEALKELPFTLVQFQNLNYEDPSEGITSSLKSISLAFDAMSNEDVFDLAFTMESVEFPVTDEHADSMTFLNPEAETLSFSVDSKVSWNLVSGLLDINYLQLIVDDMFSVNANGMASGITAELIEDYEAATKMGKTPNPLEFTDSIIINNAAVTYEDWGAAPNILKQMSKETGIPEEAITEQLTANPSIFLPEIKDPELKLLLATGIQKFLRSPETMTVRADPEESIVKLFMGIAFAPKMMGRLLNVSMEVNGEPVEPAASAPVTQRSN